eukprot:Opistho-2@20898
MSANPHAAASPVETILQLATGHIVTSALLAAVSLKVADKLRNGPKSIDAICAEEPKSQPATTYRVLRALASVGIFRETTGADHVFENTEASALLDSGAPINLWNFVNHLDCEQFRAYGHFQDALTTGTSPFKAANGSEIWTFYKEHPDRAAVFHQAMFDNSMAQLPVILPAYDFGRHKTICDIGGGKATFLIKVLEAYPSVQKALNYDLPEMIEQEATPFLATLDSAVRSKIQTYKGSFLADAASTGIPTGADLYIMKHIIHDWSDTDSITILKNTRQAIGTNTDARLCVVEMVVPEGNAPGPAKIFDLHMMAMCSLSSDGQFARERTAAEFRDLLSKSGFAVQEIIPAGRVCIISAVPV